MRHDECARDDDFKRLEAMITKVFAKMDNFIEALHGTMLADATRAARVAQIERDIIAAVKVLDKNVDNVKDLSDWKQRFTGAILVLLAIPVVCTVITTWIAVTQMRG